MKDNLGNSVARKGFARRLGERIARSDQLWSLMSDIAIPIMRRMALSGDSTDKCLQQGFLPVPIHCYQPEPDIEELEKRGVWEKVSTMKGIDSEPAEYIEFIRRLSGEYAVECRLPNEPSDNPMQFHLHNG